MKPLSPATDQEPADTRIPSSSWLTLVLLTGTYGIYTLDKYVVAVVIEPLKREFQLSDWDVSLFTGLAGTLPFLITCIPIGMLADRVDRKWLLAILVILWSGLTGLSGFATSMAFLVAARAGVAALEAGFTPLSMSIMTDKFPPRRRSTALGIFNVGAMLGVFLGLAIGGLVVSTHGWRWAFFIAGMPGLLMGIVIAAFVRDPPRGAFDGVKHAVAAPDGRFPLIAALRAMWRTPVVFQCSMGLMFCAALPSAIALWAPSFLIRVHHLPIERAGFAAALIGLATACGAAGGGLLADRLGRRDEWRKLQVPIIGCTGAILLGITGLLFSPGAVVAIVLLSLTGFVHAFYAGAGYAFVLGNTAPWLRSTVMSIVLVATNVIGGGMCSLIIGFVSDRMAPSAGPMAIAYGIAAVLPFTALGALFFFRGMFSARRAIA